MVIGHVVSGHVVRRHVTTSSHKYRGCVTAVTRAYGRAYGSLRVYRSLRPESDGLSESRSQTDYRSHRVRQTIG